MYSLAGKSVLVTGACGTVGSELLRQLLCASPPGVRRVVAIDNNESELFFLRERYRDDPRFECYLADVRQYESLERQFRDICVVFHAAALKHVILCEEAPDQAVLTNIIGTQNVIAAAVHAGCERVILTSSDKAVNPTNVMGTSKLIGEKLFTAAATTYKNSRTVFASTRFGNVLGSNGSVVQVFRRQIAARQPLTITDEAMTRFVMGVDDAVTLVLDSASLATGGEVFITKMSVVRIIDLAQAMIDESQAQQPDLRLPPMRIIGVKPGEKLYEELMNSEETRRAIELENYFVVRPPFVAMTATSDKSEYGPVICARVTRPYVSDGETALPVAEIRRLLRAKELI